MKKKKQQKTTPTRPAPAPPVVPARAKPLFSSSHLAILLALLTVLSVAPYINTFSNEFVLDDVGIIVENPLIRDLGNAGKIFTKDYWGEKEVTDPGLYRPLTVLTYATDYALWKFKPAGYHLANVGLHALTSLLLFLLGIHLLGSAMAAFSAAAIFAVHPVHTEAVTGIVGRAEILAALFFMLAFWFGRARGSPWWPNSQAGRIGARAIAAWTAAALFYFLGLLSKESAVTAPGLLLVYDLTHREKLPQNQEKKKSSMPAKLGLLLLRYVGFAIVLLVYFAMRRRAVTGRNMWVGFAGISTDDRIFTASRILMEYLALLVFPRTLSADYWKPEVPIAHSPAEPLVLLSLLLWVVLGVVAVVSWHKARPLFLALAWLFITIVPVSNLLFPIGIGKAERLLYLPSAGFCLFIGGLYGRLENKIRNEWLLVLLLLPLLFGFSVRTYARNADWKDTLTLALATLKVSPTSPLFNQTAALEYVKRGQALKAIPFLQEAIRQRPDTYFYYTNLGDAYFNSQQFDQAITTYQESIRLKPDQPAVHFSLGVLFLQKGLMDQAIKEFDEVIRLKPEFALAHSNLGVAYFNKNRMDEAIKAFRRAVEIDPNYAEAHNNLGSAYSVKGQLDLAIEHFNQALRIKPDYAQARDNLGKALDQKAQTQKQKR